MMEQAELFPGPKPTSLHRQLVEEAYKWVLKRGSCGIAFKELNTLGGHREYPDVIGFGSWQHSVLIECKTSRNDFRAEKKKSFRTNPEIGMGKFRYYCCPTGLIKVDELPAGWGLIYVNEKMRCTMIRRSGVHERFIGGEHSMMYSALRRLHLRDLMDAIYEPFPRP